MGKKILYGKDARNALLLGIDALADAVSTTLGPAGRNAVIYSRHDSPSSSRDGVTVAKAIGLDELAQDAGCQIIKAVASKTADEAGDGTTTATILARSIYKEGLAAVEGKKANPVVIRRGIDKAVGHICRFGVLSRSAWTPMADSPSTLLSCKVCCFTTPKDDVANDFRRKRFGARENLPCSARLN